MKIVEIVWYDATDRSQIKLDDIKKKDTKDFLTKRTTVGYLGNEDKFGIIIIRDICDDGECEISTIPKEFIISRKVIKK